MKTEFLKSFSKDLDKITLQDVKNNVAKTIESIEAASSLRHIKNLKKLKGFSNAYRVKIGDYRIGIFSEGSTIEFARVAHRKDIYRIFP